MRPLLHSLGALGLSLASLLCCSATALAGTLLLSADATTLPQGTSTQIHIEVAGSQLDAAPRLVNSEGFQVEMAGRSSSFTMSQGRVQQQTTYSFTVLANQAGTFTLGPAEAIVDGQRVLSDTITMTVEPPRTRATGSATSTRREQAEERWFADARLSEDHPFEGQSLSYLLDIGTAVSVRGTQWNRPAWGHLSPAPGVEPTQSSRLEVIEGRRFEVTTLVMPLFALEAGPTRIEPSVVEFTVPQRARSFFDLGVGKQYQEASDALEFEVRALPVEGRPNNFNGAVGNFSLRASLDRNRVAAGETVTLTLQLAGSGGLRSPRIQVQLPDKVRRYSEQPEQVAKLVGRSLRTEVTLREALVPLEPGTITIPPVSFSFFDPEQEQYRTVRSQAITLHVSGEAVAEQAVIARSADIARNKEAVEVLGSDIIGLHAEKLCQGDGRLNLGSFGILAALLLPLVSFLSISTAQRRKRISGTSLGQAKERGRRARDAAKELKSAGAKAPLEAAEATWRRWLGARLDRSGEALSAGDASAALRQAGCNAELAQRAERLLERIESVRFGGATAGTLVEEILDWTLEAERSWK